MSVVCLSFFSLLFHVFFCFFLSLILFSFLFWPLSGSPPCGREKSNFEKKETTKDTKLFNVSVRFPILPFERFSSCICMKSNKPKIIVRTDTPLSTRCSHVMCWWVAGVVTVVVRTDDLTHEFILARQ